MMKTAIVLFLFIAGCSWNEVQLQNEDQQTPHTEIQTESVPEIFNSSQFKINENTEKKEQKTPPKKRLVTKTKEISKTVNPVQALWAKQNWVHTPNESFNMDITFFGVTAGRVYFRVFPDVHVGEELAHRFYAKIVSAPFYKYIYEIEDTLEVLVSKDRKLPIKYTLIQRESKQDVDDYQVFDFVKGETTTWYRRLKRGEEKKEQKVFPIPPLFLDSFTPLYFIRGLPFEIGQSYAFPVVTRGKIWDLTAEVVAIEDVKVQKQNISAYKLKVETQFPGVLDKKGDAWFWFAKEPPHLPLKFEAKIKLGTIGGILTSPIPK